MHLALGFMAVALYSVTLVTQYIEVRHQYLCMQ